MTKMVTKCLLYPIPKERLTLSQSTQIKVKLFVFSQIGDKCHSNEELVAMRYTLLDDKYYIYFMNKSSSYITVCKIMVMHFMIIVL